MSRGSTVPVGLLGLQTNTTDGRVVRSSSAAEPTSIAKSGPRSPTTTSVAVARAIWACSAYVGSNINARRPAPP